MTTPTWQQGNTVAQTLAVLETITQKYAKPEYQDVVVAIELLNEPLSFDLNFDELKQFYRDGFDQVRAVSNTPVMLHDGFVSPSTWNGFLCPADNNAQNGMCYVNPLIHTAPELTNVLVIVDHHEYQVFTNELIALQPSEHIQLVCSNAQNYTSGTDKWLVVGEWTAALTDCAPALNGYNIGARYDGSYPGSSYIGSCAGKSNIAHWDATMKANVREYIETQLSAFERYSQGWVFWNFKTEAAHEWDAFVLLENGVFPQPLTAREFNTPC
jgi:glucan 1,3-beta-glucosidase